MTTIPADVVSPTLTRRPAALSWLVFPALLAAVIATALTLMQRGLPLPVVSSATTLAALALILLLERLLPLHRSWNARPAGVDLLLLVVNRAIDIVVTAATVALLARLERAGVDLGLVALWPVRAPLLLQAALGIGLAEAVRYLLHRLSHRPGLLGRVHRTHHQPQRMYSLNGPRLHPGNYLWIAFANSVPMLVLGAPLAAVVLAAIITAFFVLFQHANLRLRFDGWNRVFATPDVHRLHHLRANSGRAVNYGIVLLLLDVAFGTYAAATTDTDIAADAIGPAPVPPLGPNPPLQSPSPSPSPSSSSVGVG